MATRILNFHGLAAPERPVAPDEARYWLGADAFAAIVAMVAARPDRAEIAITFDDGNSSDLTVGAPVLRRAGLSATVFALAGRLGQPGSLDAAGLRALRAEGFDIGSHGFGHVDWRRLDAAGRAREFAEARAILAAASGAPVRAAAIPFGAYDRRVLGWLRAAGYEAVYTSDGGPAGAGPVFARTSVTADMTPDAVAAILDGREGLARRLRRRAAILRKRLF